MKQNSLLIPLLASAAFLLIGVAIFPLVSESANSGIQKMLNNRGLVGYWSFNDGSGTKATDFSGQSHVGTLTNIASPATATSGWADGKVARALAFDGTDDFVTGSMSGFNTGTSARTIAGWIKMTDTSSVKVPFVYGSCGSGNDGKAFGVYLSSSEVLNFWGCGTADFSTGVTVSTDVWHHIAVTYDGTNVKVYVDGAQAGATTARTLGVGSAAWVAGSDGSVDTADYPFAGSIDEVRVYTRALSQSEVASLYTGKSTILAASKNTHLTSGLIGLWSLDGQDMLNGIALDRSGNGRNATLYNIATSSFYVPGPVNQALSFDGSDDYAQTSATTWGISNTLSFSAWVKTTANTVAIAALGRSTVTDEAMLYIHNNGAAIILSNGTFLYNGIYGNTVVNDGQWHHIVGTVNGSNACASMKLYVDGVREGTENCLSSSGTNISDSTARSFFLGWRAWGSGASEIYSGKLDDVRLYNRVLSAAEALELYRLGNSTKIKMSQNTKSRSGLVGLWPLDGQDISGMSGDVILDRSGNGNDGSMVTMTRAAARPGKIGQALVFNGVDEYVDLVNNLDSFATPAISIALWLKRDSTSFAHDQGIMGCVNNGGWGFGLDGTNVLGRPFITKIGASAAYSDGTVIDDTDWHHLVISYDGLNTRFYLDGVLDATVSYTESTFNCAGAGYTLGNSNSSTFFEGRLDDVRIYNRAITASEVSALYRMAR